MTKHAAILCLTALAVPAAADDHAPATLDLPIQWVGTITVPPEKGKLATLRASGSNSGEVLADLPVGTRVKVMDDSKPFLHVEIDTAQKGVVLNQTSTKGKDAAGMVRGYVFKDLVTR